MKAKSVRDQRRADQKQKAEREHRDGWIDDWPTGGNASNYSCRTVAINSVPAMAMMGSRKAALCTSNA